MFYCCCLNDEQEIVEKYGLCYFMMHNPKIHDSTVQDSCINSVNRLQSCGENYAFEKQHFAEGPTTLFIAPYEHIFLCIINRNLAIFFRLILSSTVLNSLLKSQNKWKMKLGEAIWWGEWPSGSKALQLESKVSWFKPH